MTEPIRIGSRGSPLALKQASIVKEKLKALGYAVDIIPFTTSGDRLKDQPLERLGGKVLFTKEIEEALSLKLVDIAVHSVKDVEVFNPRGLVLAGSLERDDPREAFISTTGIALAYMPAQAVIGTASPRREAQVLETRPDLRVTLFRGNVQTRLNKLEKGLVDGTFLAMAGLIRLGLTHKVVETFSVQEMVPAVGQGAIGLQCHEDNTPIKEVIHQLSHLPTFQAIKIERSFLRGFEGSCTTPVGGHYNGDTLYVWASCGGGCHFHREQHFLKELTFAEACTQAFDIGRSFAAWRRAHYDHHHQAC